MTGFLPTFSALLLYISIGYAEDSYVEFLIGLQRNVRLYNSSEFNSYEDILNTQDEVLHVDYHLENNLAFIVTNLNIYRAQLKPADNSTVKSILSYNDSSASLAVDWVHDKLYFIQKYYSQEVPRYSLSVLDLDGTNVKHLLDVNDDRFFNMSRIRVDPYQGKIFWSRTYNREEGILESCDLTGANHQKISDSTNVGSEVFLDLAAKRIWYTFFNKARFEYKLKDYYSVQSMNYNGGEKENHLHTQKIFGVCALYYHNWYVYWAVNINGSSIFTAPVNQPSPREDLVKKYPQFSGSTVIMHMNLVHPDFQKQH